MPVYSSKDIIPFINALEAKVNEIVAGVEEWEQEKGMILTSIPQISSNKTRSTTAMVKADEALTELNTATFDIVAKRGQRLKTLIDNLKNQMYDIAKEAGNNAGYDPRIKAEIDNAISSVDGIISDGLKLDYRLRKLQELAMEGKTLSEKELYIPYAYEVQNLTDTFIQIPNIDGITFLDGDVSVLNLEGDPCVDGNNQIISGTITAAGEVQLNAAPNQSVKLYFPVTMDLKEVPADFLLLTLNTMIQKNSKYLQQILSFQKEVDDILTEIKAMKGQNWTADFSIMRNHKEIVEEAITPKGLQVEVKDGIAYAKFSYNDHPYLSHFVLEKWDEEQKKFVPWDGEYGIVNK